MRKIYVGFTGKAGAGKDHVADLVENALYKRGSLHAEKVPWARGVREEIEIAILGYPDGEGGLLDLLYQKPTEPTMIRPLLQWWGTDFRRAQDPDYWVKWGLKAAEETDADVILFPDTRFMNEAQAIIDAGGFLVNVRADEAARVRRIGVVPDHLSEQLADELPSTISVWNNGDDLITHHELLFAAQNIVDEILKRRTRG